MLGFVSLFMDVSSELIHSLLPVFMVSSLGATALIVKVFSGTLSDYLGKRKALAVFGYAGAVFSLLAFMMLALRRTDHKSRWA